MHWICDTNIINKHNRECCDIKTEKAQKHDWDGTLATKVNCSLTTTQLLKYSYSKSETQRSYTYILISLLR